MTTVIASNQDFFTKPVGDPFADTGGFVLQYLQERDIPKPDASVLEVVEWAAERYVKQWDAKLDSFFLNSTLTHNSVKGQQKVTKTVSYFRSLFEGTNDEGVKGFCRISGQQGWVYPAGRHNALLVGSKAFFNFHHHHEDGVLMCKEMLVRIFFVPLAALQIGNRLAVVVSNRPELTQALVEKRVKENLNRFGTRTSTGVLKSEFNLTVNALFDLADEVMEVKEEDFDNDEAVELTLFHFTNFGQSPEVDIHHLPADVFDFYRSCNSPELKAGWLRFVHNFYRNKSSDYDVASDTFRMQEKGETVTVPQEQFRRWRNTVYERLLQRKTIQPQMIHWLMKKRQPLDKRVIRYYHIKVLNMTPKTVDKIRDVAGFIISRPERLKRTLASLRKAQRPFEFRNTLLKLVEDNYSEKNKEPLFTVDEYIQDIAPDDIHWREIRDLLLITVYQKLHEEENFEEEVIKEED